MGRKFALLFLLLLAAFAGGIYITYAAVWSRLSGSAVVQPSAAFAVGANGATTPFAVKTDADPIKDPGAIANAAAIVEPSVVTIDTEYRPRLRYGNDDVYGEEQVMQEVPRGTGSGVILSADGVIVTNNHVVQNATKISVTLSDGREVAGQVLGADPQSDLAVVKVDEKNLPAITLADSDKVRVGEWVVAVGDPLRVGTTVTAGIVSAIRKNQPTGAGTSYATLLQTDAAINPGNSGGALTDIQGRLIGINSAIASNNGGSIGIGYAIPANTVREITKQLIERGHVSRPFLGVAFGTLTSRDREQMNLRDAPDGVYVGQVQPGSPADTAGLQPGDIILSMNGTNLKTSEGMQSTMQSAKVGDALRLTVWRHGTQQNLIANLTERPTPVDAR